MFDIVIGHSASDQYRNRNLAYTLGYYYRKCPQSKIIVVEQNTTTTIKTDSRVTHIKLAPKTLYNRGLGFNEGFKHIIGNSVLFVDNDCIIDPKILDNIKNHFTKDALIPYNLCIDLNKQETDHLIVTSKVVGGMSRGGRNNCVGGALFISSDVFKSIRGYDELIGWGGEDECMFHKLSTLYKINRVQGNFPMFHLYHPSAVSKPYLDSPAYLKNLELVNKMKAMDKDTLLEYLNPKNP